VCVVGCQFGVQEEAVFSRKASPLLHFSFITICTPGKADFSLTINDDHHSGKIHGNMEGPRIFPLKTPSLDVMAL